MSTPPWINRVKRFNRDKKIIYKDIVGDIAHFISHYPDCSKYTFNAYYDVPIAFEEDGLTFSLYPEGLFKMKLRIKLTPQTPKEFIDNLESYILQRYYGESIGYIPNEDRTIFTLILNGPFYLHIGEHDIQ